MSRTGTIRRADWLRQEISLIDELLGNLGGTSAALVGFARSRWFALTDEREQLFSELASVALGSKLDLRFSGQSVQANRMEMSALSDLLQPVSRLLDQFGSDAFVSTRPGSFVLEIGTAPQLELVDPGNRIDPVGLLLSDVAAAGSEKDVELSVEAAVDQLGRETVRAAASFVGTLRHRKLDVEIHWVNQRGSSRRTSLTRDRSSAVFHALQQTELQSESYEVSGELRGVMLEGRSTFQIRTDEGTVISGLVSREAAPKVIGFSIGQRVTAKVERRIRRRVASSYETTTHRLMGLNVEAPSSGAQHPDPGAFDQAADR